MCTSCHCIIFELIINNWIQSLLIIRMKVIKHLKHETPQHRLKQFFKQMPLITRIIIPAVITVTTLLAGLEADDQFTGYSFLDARPFPEMAFFMIIGLTDIQREERSGSIFFILSYIIKISTLAGFNKLLIICVQKIGISSDFIVTTSYPMAYLFMIAYRDAVLKVDKQRYFLIAPFQIKAVFYPIFLAIIFQLIELRVDLISAFIISMIVTALRIDEVLQWFSKKLDKKCIGNKAVGCGMLPTGCSEVALSQVDRVTTNHSIVLDQS